MLNITLPDGSVRPVEPGTTGHALAASISEGLARNALAVRVNGEVRDLHRAFTEDATVEILTWNDDAGKATYWHSSAHLMAEALEALYPGVKLAIGPAIENGFYYDVDLGEGRSISSEDFPEIEKKMLELAKAKNRFVRQEISKADAIAYFQ